MAELRRFSHPIAERRVPGSTLDPLHRRLIAWGMGATILGGLLFSSLLAAAAFGVLFLAAVLVWRRDETPILAYAIGYQWVFVVAGYLYRQITGYYPRGGWADIAGDMEHAITLALLGFVVLAIGIRLGFALQESHLSGVARRLRAEMPHYSVHRLFWCVVVLYAVNYLVQISPMAIFFNAAQFLYALLDFREVLFVLLWYVTLRQRKGYQHSLLASIFVFVPTLASKQSRFTDVFFILFIVLIAHWRPWSELEWERRRSFRVLLLCVGLTIALVFMGTLWEGAIKPNWRWLDVEGAPLDRVATFYRVASDAIARVDLDRAFEALVSRVSSIEQFSLVLERVPRLIPYENGRLTQRAIEHVLKPRILFPDKPTLWDSVLATTYAGLVVGEGTSVGIGYMAEFYVDFGIPGMFLPLFFYGFLISVVYWTFLRFSPSYDLFKAVVTVIFLNNFTTFEGNFAKLLGGLVMDWLVFFVILSVLGTWLHRRLVLNVDLV